MEKKLKESNGIKNPVGFFAFTVNSNFPDPKLAEIQSPYVPVRNMTGKEVRLYKINGLTMGFAR